MRMLAFLQLSYLFQLSFESVEAPLLLTEPCLIKVKKMGLTASQIKRTVLLGEREDPVALQRFSLELQQLLQMEIMT